jgi:PAS domain-containing protein
MDLPTRPERSAREVFLRIERSHRTVVGGALVPVDGDVETRERWLYTQAPFGLLAHDGGSDPRFVYANRTAQRWFEYGWDELVGRPSRESAGPEDQAERDRLLADAARKGWSDGYRGVRVSRTGRRFRIEDVLMWNLLDDAGERCGQAARIRSCRPVVDDEHARPDR